MARKQVVHKVISLSGIMFRTFEFKCGITRINEEVNKIKFTNHDPDVTCKRCKKRLMAKKGGK